MLGLYTFRRTAAVQNNTSAGDCSMTVSEVTYERIMCRVRCKTMHCFISAGISSYCITSINQSPWIVRKTIGKSQLL